MAIKAINGEDCGGSGTRKKKKPLPVLQLGIENGAVVFEVLPVSDFRLM